MSQITYDNKDKTNVDGVHNKWLDSDANQVKAAVNSKLDATNANQWARGSFNMDAGVLPVDGGSVGSGPGGQILAGDTFDFVLTNPDGSVTVGSGVGARNIVNGSTGRALINSPTTTLHWKFFS